MTRANARELAVHLIYGRNFTGEEPQSVVNTRLDKEYYEKLSSENDVYADRPSRAQLRYIDSVVAGVANRTEDLNAEIQKFCDEHGLPRRRNREFTPINATFPPVDSYDPAEFPNDVQQSMNVYFRRR